MGLLDTLSMLKDKFDGWRISKKKIKALFNYCNLFGYDKDEKKQITLLYSLAESTSLSDIWVKALQELVDKKFVKYHYLDLAYETQWLKRERNTILNEMASQHQMDIFVPDKVSGSPLYIPPEVMIPKSGYGSVRKGV